MKRHSKWLFALAAGFVATGGCSAHEESDAPEAPSAVAKLRLDGNGIRADALGVAPWGDNVGFNCWFNVTNTGSDKTSYWEVDLQLPDAKIVTGPWNAVVVSTSGTIVTLRSNADTSVMKPGETISVNFNGAWSKTPHSNPSIIAVRRYNATPGVGGASSGGASSGTSAIPSTTGGSAGATGVNLAQEKPATASSSLIDSPPSYGNDASNVTSWCASSNALNEWWQVDLGGPHDLTGTEITWPYAGRVYQYSVGVSNDGLSFVEVVNQRGNLRTSQVQFDSFASQGRYLRVIVTGLTSSPVTSACISDLKAFGAPASGSGQGGATGTTGVGTGFGGALGASGGSIGSGGTGVSTSSSGTLSEGSGGGSTTSGSGTSSGGSTGAGDRRTFSIRLPGGVRRQDVAVGTDGGPVSVSDRVQVVREDGTYSSVTGMALPPGSRIGVEAHVANAWVDGAIQLANRTTVESFVKATGTIGRESDTNAAVEKLVEHYSFTPPEVIRWHVDFPIAPANSAVLAVEETRVVAPDGYDTGYVPRDAHLRLSAGTYTFNRLTVEDSGVVELDNSAGPIFVYIRDNLAFRGRTIRTIGKANVLFGVAGTEPVSVERAFVGILVAPNAPVTLTSAVEHRGSFFGKGVTVLQQARIVHEPLDPKNFCATDAECSDFCPCGGDTCGESTCPEGTVCGANQGRRYGRASGISVCMDPMCVSGGYDCGTYKDTCGRCNSYALACDSDSDCMSGDVCGTANGWKLGRFPSLNVCWSAVCQSAPNSPPNCGDKDAGCGMCDCQAVCATKTCGDDPSDGCGGTCVGLCENGQGGCAQDSDCPTGSVCGYGIGARFGLGSSTNVCWPAACRVQDPAKPNGRSWSWSIGLGPF